MDAPMDRDVPLVVDLDGTLVRSDMLLETLVGALARRPWLAACIPFWLARGRAHLKRELALRCVPDAARLPFREEMLELVARERATGRRIVLATASDERIARRIAEHLGCFDEVLASDGRRNLKGAAKRDALVERFGEGGFDYAGDEAADLPVWSAARRAIVVEGRRTSMATFARALRVQQWPKNLLVFVPLVTAHLVGDASAFGHAFAAFGAFSLVASGVYLVNDLLDLEADRTHERKRRRPFASGELGIGWGLALAPACLAAGLALAAWIGSGTAIVVACYAVTAMAYTTALKRMAPLDVFVIAALYTLRILAGAVAIDVVVSDWLFAFSMFIFLSLAFAKRHGELARQGAPEELPGRGYRRDDAAFVATAGMVNGYLSIVVLAFYVTSGEVRTLYARPAILWLMVVLMLFWITRVWLLAARRRLDEDPLAFALRDPASYAVGAMLLATVYAAT